MQGKVLTNFDEVTEEWLTSVLMGSGALTDGAVAAFDIAGGRGNWSTHAHLVLQYADGSQGNLPQRLFLKLVNADVDDEFFGDSEVLYYTRDYVDVKNAPIIRCYDGVFSAEKRRYHLLLDDLSESHVVATKKAPTLGYGLALAEGLATLHARWCGAERFAQAGATMHAAEHIRRFVEIAEPGAEHIIQQFSAELKPHWPDAIQKLYAKHPSAMIERTRSDNGFTLIHGDVGSGNILVPREGDSPIYIIDRQPFDWSLTTWLGVYDLAYLMVLDWDVETRRNLENAVLRHYYEQLIQNGINGYSWEQLYDDYRLSVGMGVYIATEYCRSGINERWVSTWLPMLQRSLTACDDLECSKLWDGNR